MWRVCAPHLLVSVLPSKRLVQRHANTLVQSRGEKFEVKTSVLQSKTSQHQVLSSVFLKYSQKKKNMWLALYRWLYIVHSFSGYKMKRKRKDDEMDPIEPI